MSYEAMKGLMEARRDGGSMTNESSEYNAEPVNKLWNGKHFSAWHDNCYCLFYVIEHSNKAQFLMDSRQDAIETAKSWNSRKAQVNGSK